MSNKFEKNTKNYCYAITSFDMSISKEQLMENIINKWQVLFCIIGSELTQKDNPHYQIYIRFLNRIYINSVNDFFNDKCHIEIAYKNDLANYNYCKKENDFITYGTIDISQKELKSGVDVSEMVIDIMSDKYSYYQLICKYGSYALYHYRDFKQLVQDLNPFLIRDLTDTQINIVSCIKGNLIEINKENILKIDKGDTI